MFHELFRPNFELIWVFQWELLRILLPKLFHQNNTSQRQHSLLFIHYVTIKWTLLWTEQLAIQLRTKELVSPSPNICFKVLCSDALINVDNPSPQRVRCLASSKPHCLWLWVNNIEWSLLRLSHQQTVRLRPWAPLCTPVTSGLTADWKSSTDDVLHSQLDWRCTENYNKVFAGVPTLKKM